MHVSVTGLTPHGIWQVPLFWRHAIPSMVQARRAPGNLFAAARKVDGVQHTLTVWEDAAAMRAFVSSGAHLAAMQAFRRIGTGRIGGYTSATMPGWDEALAFWHEHARQY